MIAGLVWVAGCMPASEPVEPESYQSPRLPLLTLDAIAENEPNDDFALPDDHSSLSSAVFAGQIAAENDIDVFRLAGVRGGDRVAIDAERDCADARVRICLFDDQSRLLMRKTGSPSGQAVPWDVIAPNASDYLYLVGWVSNDHWPCDYVARCRIEPGPFSRVVRPQTVTLDFGPARNVEVGDQLYNLGAFDAADISPAFTGRTDEIMERVLAMVRADFEGLDVSVHLSGDVAAPAWPRSVVYFGASSPDLLGSAGSVDDGNADGADSAIVFTDSFRLFMLLGADATEIAQALANVTSHEVGHLLGLWHTDDPNDLMDITASARRMLADQSFAFAPLHRDVAPMGFQDAPSQLSWTVGGTLAKPVSPPARSATAGGGGFDFVIPREWLSSHGQPMAR